MTGLAELKTLLAIRRRRELRAGELAARRQAAAVSAGTAAEQAAATLASHDQETLALQRSRHRGLMGQSFSLAGLEQIRHETMIADAMRLNLEAATAAAAETLALRQSELTAARTAHRARRHDRLRLEQAHEEQAKRERRWREARLDAAQGETAGRGRATP
ncbi:hypothetical protein LJR090_000154 [Bosea sp. LjRoot90]|uniref:hypothetical protein n=1 Tax=Bosea sp. LjRoot90 TaxID=3342342 RepID=UPI003ECD5702